MTPYLDTTAENLQKTVGGYIEKVTYARAAVVICNDEGRLRGLPFNCHLFGVDFVGTIIFAGVKGDEFTDFPMSFKHFKRQFPALWQTEEE